MEINLLLLLMENIFIKIEFFLGVETNLILFIFQRAAASAKTKTKQSTFRNAVTIYFIVSFFLNKIFIVFHNCLLISNALTYKIERIKYDRDLPLLKVRKTDLTKASSRYTRPSLINGFLAILNPFNEMLYMPSSYTIGAF